MEQLRHHLHPPVYEGEIVVAPAKVTLIHNGFVVQNGQSFLGPTTHQKLAAYSPKHPVSAPIRLHFQGDTVEFRNIRVRPLGERGTGKKLSRSASQIHFR